MCTFSQQKITKTEKRHCVLRNERDWFKPGKDCQNNKQVTVTGQLFTCAWKGSLRNIVTDNPAVVPTSGVSRSSPAAFPNVVAGAGISAGPDYAWKTQFDNIASGAGAGTGEAGVCESALTLSFASSPDSVHHLKGIRHHYPTFHLSANLKRH